MISKIAAFFSIGLMCLSLPVVAEEPWRGGEFQGTVILTVSGNIGNATRTGNDENVDKFFDYNAIDFDEAAQFDYAALAALPQHTVSADFPKDGPVVTFTGPLLADVLDAAGADGELVTVSALDGYAIEAPLSKLIEYGAIVALSRDGVIFGIGDFGPTQIAFPRAERAALSDMNDDWWVWSIYHIRVE